jgi:dolichyl-phosphate beta-glucosyltransferase
MRPIAVMVLFTVIGSAPVVLATTRRRRSQDVRVTLTRRRGAPGLQGGARLSVIVPAFREPQIGDTVKRIRTDLAVVDAAGGLEIIVVDDGSGDDTATRALAAGADVISLPENRGKGAAVRTSMLAASGRVLCFTDADLAYSPDQIVALLHHVEDGWDVAIGNRDHDAARAAVDTTLLRRLGHRGIALLTRTVLVGRHADTQCGIKAFRRDVAHHLFGMTRVDRFAFDIELIHLVERCGYSLVDVPVTVENHDRSTVRVARDTVRLLRDLARIRHASRTGRYLGPVSGWPRTGDAPKLMRLHPVSGAVSDVVGRDAVTA